MHGYGLSHSLGDRRPNMKKLKDTAKKEKPRNTQTSSENGSMNVKSSGVAFWGFKYRIAMPKKYIDIKYFK